MGNAAPVALPEVVPTPAPNTFAQLLVHRAATMGDRVAYRMFDARGEERGQLSYGALYGDALALATQLRTRTTPGDRVALLLPPGLAYVTALYACFLAQVVAVPAPPLRGRRDSTRVPRLLADAAATADAVGAALTTPALASALALAAAAALLSAAAALGAEGVVDGLGDEVPVQTQLRLRSQSRCGDGGGEDGGKGGDGDAWGWQWQWR